MSIMRNIYKPQKRNLIVYLLLLLAIIISMFCMRSCKKGAIYHAAQIGGSKGDTIDIALIYAPLSYYMYEDTLGGYCYDALRMAAEITNTKIRLWPVVSLDDALQKLKNGDFDVVAPLSVDNSLRSKFEFTKVIYFDKQVLVQLRDSVTGKIKISSSLDLAKDTIHLVKSSPVINRLHNLMSEIGDTIYAVTHDDLSDEYLIMKVAAGNFRNAVVADRIARQLKSQYPMIDYSTPISFTQFQAGVIRKGDSITNKKITEMIEAMETSSAIHTLKLRYGI